MGDIVTSEDECNTPEYKSNEQRCIIYNQLMIQVPKAGLRIEELKFLLALKKHVDPAYDKISSEDLKKLRKLVERCGC